MKWHLASQNLFVYETLKSSALRGKATEIFLSFVNFAKSVVLVSEV